MNKDRPKIGFKEQTKTHHDGQNKPKVDQNQSKPDNHRLKNKPNRTKTRPTLTKLTNIRPSQTKTNQN